MSEIYDLVILGGGPAGYRAAERAGHHGMKTLLIERRALGGVCLNEGCIPTKTLLHSAKLYDYAKGEGKKYGVTAENAKLDHAYVISRKDKIVKKLVAGVGAQMKKYGVTVAYESGVIEGKTTEGFCVKTENGSYTGKRLLICTGSEAAVPPVPGLKEAIDSGFAMTNREILGLKEVPASLIVMGGGVIGLEMASYFNSAGTKVTVVEMLDRLAGQTDPEICGILRQEYEKKGVNFMLSAKVTGVSGGSCTVEHEGKMLELKADRLLVSTGRRPNTAGIGLESIGVMTERGAIVTDEYMKTNIPGVFAAGDVNGKSMLAHTAYREAEAAVNVMLGRKDRMRYNAVPAVIYTNPEVASVGETMETAQARGLKVSEVKLPMMFSGRYMAENEAGNGIMKLVLGDGGRILGLSMIANPSSEIIYGMAMAIEREMYAKDLLNVIFPHPSVGEAIREAVLGL